MTNTENLDRKILRLLENECMLTEEVQVQNYVLTRKEQIIKNHVENVFPIKEPGEKGGHPNYWMTKLEPHNRKNDKKVYGKTREDLETKVIAHYLKIQDDSKITVRDVLVKAVDVSSETGKRTLQRFDKHLSEIANIQISSLGEDDIRKALDNLIKERVTQKEFNSTITCFNKIAAQCDYEHMEVCDIKKIIALYRQVKLSGKHVFVENQKQSKNLAFNRREASVIVNNALKHPTYKGLAVALLIVTGLRAGELLGLRTDDVFVDELYLWIHQIEDTKTHKIQDWVKENRCREVYLSIEAEQVIKACLKLRESDPSESPYLFLNENSEDGKMHLRAIDDYLRETVHYDILDLGSDREARSAHDCRRTYASLEYLNGTDIYTLKNQLGHSSIIQTEDYIKDIIDSSERPKRLKGCGLLTEKPSVFAVDANRRKKTGS
ncbi:MAG: site-specific integrase [Pseudobutyrivibrio sp.]|nr:site-specific integrase [Pseudobutyrivibrio sp.]